MAFCTIGGCAPTTREAAQARIPQATPSAEAPYDAHLLDVLIEQEKQTLQAASQTREATALPKTKELTCRMIVDSEANLIKLEAWRKQWYPAVTRLSPNKMQARVASNTPPASSGDTEKGFLKALATQQDTASGLASEAQQRAEHQELKEFCASRTVSKAQEIVDLKNLQKELLNP